MTKSNSLAALVSTALLAALGGCSSGGGNNAVSANVSEGAAVVPSAAPAGPPLGPLTAQQICDGLSASAVGGAIGQTITAAAPSSASTPQCSYTYSAGGSTTNITVAYMRTVDDLAGNEGEAGFDYVMRTNRSIAPGAQEQAIQAGQRAMRISGSTLHLGAVLTRGRVITAITPAALPADAVDRLVQAAAEAFGR